MKIKEVILNTSNLENQIIFYRDLLGFSMLRRTSHTCSFEIGSSILSFEFNEKSKPYHFAFNIPSNKEYEALEWLEDKVEVLPFNGEKLVDFKSWNAKAMYFYDVDRNIVELIARNNLDIKQETKFSANSVLNISEIGLVHVNLKTIYKRLNELRKIFLFSGDFERFCALGNDEGLFILVNREKKKWYPTNDIVYQTDFKIYGDYNFEYKNGEIIEIN